MKPKVIVAPSFREMGEIFDAPTLVRLHELGDVQWGENGPMPQELFEAAAQDATAIIFGTWHYGSDAVAAAGPSLRHIFEVAGTHNHPDLDYRACFARGITVGSCAPAFAPAVAEHALALSLAAGRLVTEGDAGFRTAEELWLHEGNVGTVTHFGKTVGFVGAGGLARSLQPLLAPFGVRFLAYDPWLGAEALHKRGLEPAELKKLFIHSDIVYVLAVPTPDNVGLVSRELMELLGPNNILVVMSRAHLVDFEAMTDLVLQCRFRAACDVFPIEPLAVDHPIRQASNIVLSAHRAGAIPEALLGIGRMVVDDLDDLLAGRLPRRMQYANPEMIRGLGGLTVE